MVELVHGFAWRLPKAFAELKLSGGLYQPMTRTNLTNSDGRIDSLPDSCIVHFYLKATFEGTC